VQQLPASVTLTAEEGEALIGRVHASGLGAADCQVVERVIRLHFWLLFALQEAKLSLKRLRTLLFGEPAHRRSVPSAHDSFGASGPERSAGGDAAAGWAAGKVVGQPHPAGGHRPGQGRLSAEAYAGAERVACRHEALRVGEVCPVCGQGRLYAVPPGVEIRLDGNALLSAIRDEWEKLRCSGCGQVFTAALPEEAGGEKYSPRARAVLALGRYYLGLPFYRLAGYQGLLGVPMPDATQWDQVERVADCGYIVFRHLECLAAQGELIYQDDTPVRILSLIDENRHAHAQAKALGLSRSTERTGMYTTGFVVKAGEHTICLYYSGRTHAGENLKSLLLQRAAHHGKPLVMSDALSSNDANEQTLIRCHCLAHGRRKFSELEDVFPDECKVVIDALKQVFDHEDKADEQLLSAQERLAYHQVYSGPILQRLKKWLEQQCDERLVEPNSSLGKAIAYLLNHWETLTRFLSVPGAPLENNLVERALKLFIRQRKNSLFYATEHSAYIASVLTSLIATCLHAEVNALEYLVAVQEHRREVFRDPAAWLPWNYQGNLVPP
jgi:hypothetical protein